MISRPGNCPLNCNYTQDRDMLNQSSAVIFHLPTFWTGSVNNYLKLGPDGEVYPEQLREFPNFPPYKLKGQKWVIFSMEPEGYYHNLINKEYMDQFDLKMTYFQDSDIPALFMSGKPGAYFGAPINKTPDHLCVFIASNCGSLNGREEYVTELQKYMRVDSYGSCLHNKDWPSGDKGTKSKMELLQTYKFYLVFENSNSRDYVSEKYFHALAAGTVPVYLGAPNIDDFKPAPRSVIKTSEFQSPKDLAEYLLMLDKNDKLYNEYLSWKFNGMVSSRFQKMMNEQKRDARCRLCQIFTKEGYKNSLLDDT